MKSIKKVNEKHVRIGITPDSTSPDNDADKSGTDRDSDKTHKAPGKNKFDKPGKEVDPDKTGIDTESDKTKK